MTYWLRNLLILKETVSVLKFSAVVFCKVGMDLLNMGGVAVNAKHIIWTYKNHKYSHVTIADNSPKTVDLKNRP